jgi:hypothetical protein
MCAKIGAGGDIARQRGQPARAVAECLGLLAQPQCDLAEEQGQAGEHAGLQQRRPHRGTALQRCQQGERADATGQPHRQAIAMAQQHAQQQGDRQCRRQADDRAQHGQLQRQQQRQAVAGDAAARQRTGQPQGGQHSARGQRGGHTVRTAQGQHQASHGQRRAADQQAAVSAAGELLQVRQAGGIGGTGGCNGHRRLLDQQTTTATPQRTQQGVTRAVPGIRGMRRDQRRGDGTPRPHPVGDGAAERACGLPCRTRHTPQARPGPRAAGAGARN